VWVGLLRITLRSHPGLLPRRGRMERRATGASRMY